MKNKFLLLFLPLILSSCSKFPVSNQQEVSYAKMMVELNEFDQIRKAKEVTATYSIRENTDNWDIIGYSDDEFQTGYQVSNFTQTWNVDYILNSSGVIISEYDIESAPTTPYYIDLHLVEKYFKKVQDSEDSVLIKFYLNPYKIELDGFRVNTVNPGSGSVFLLSSFYSEETFDSEQWIQKYTLHEYYYIYNYQTGVQAWRELDLTCKFTYHSYH